MSLITFTQIIRFYIDTRQHKKDIFNTLQKGLVFGLDD